MKYIANHSTDPHYNLAFEEYVFTKLLDDDYILIWQNDNAIIVGKHQNTAQEINPQAVRELGVKVVRRITGGGAVYHDMGNVNFSFISNIHKEADISYDRFLIPVINTLAGLGVKAEKKGRNDIVVQDKKISGNAQALHRNRILHHGTLLFDSDLSVVQKVLQVTPDKIVSKGIQSVRSRVANIKEFLPDKDITVARFKQHLIETFHENVTEVFLSEAQIKEIEILAKEKYASWDWNYGRSPQFNMNNALRFPAGRVEVQFNVQDGHIKDCKVWGDFLSLQPVEAVEKNLIGTPYEESAVYNVLSLLPLHQYFGEISAEDLIKVFFYAN